MTSNTSNESIEVIKSSTVSDMEVKIKLGGIADKIKMFGGGNNNCQSQKSPSMAFEALPKKTSETGEPINQIEERLNILNIKQDSSPAISYKDKLSLIKKENPLQNQENSKNEFPKENPPLDKEKPPKDNTEIHLEKKEESKNNEVNTSNIIKKEDSSQKFSENAAQNLSGAKIIDIPKTMSISERIKFLGNRINNMSNAKHPHPKYSHDTHDLEKPSGVSSCNFQEIRENIKKEGPPFKIAKSIIKDQDDPHHKPEDNKFKPMRQGELPRKSAPIVPNVHLFGEKKIQSKGKFQTIQKEIPEVFLSSVEIPEQILNESFCEGFFISSFPTQNAKAVENSDDFLSTCGHKLCSSLPAMQPEIIYRYPQKDTKSLELNNLAASICFPNGIKLCYEEDGQVETVKNYSSSITNQQGDRYYMVTYHFYYKILNYQFVTKYQMYPIKSQTMKFCNDYYEKIETDETLQNEIAKKLEEYSEINFRETVHIPFCLCLISKYPYFNQMEKCLESIRNNISNYNAKSEECIELITYVVRSIPIPPVNTKVKFALPFIPEIIEIMCPNNNDMSLLSCNTTILLNLFSIENIILIFRLMIFEQKLLFVDNEYDRLSEVTNSFISLLYPFQWIHTYIPIMSDQMLKYLQAFLPFLNGIHESLYSTAIPVLEEADEGVFIIWTTKNVIDINSKGKKIKIKKKIDETVPNLPREIEEKITSELKRIKDTMKQKQNQPKFDKNEIEIMMKNLFIQSFVEMFYDYNNYLTLIDDYPVFNVNALLQGRSLNDERFYKEFTETQLFQLFLQNIVKDDEHKMYFNHRSKQYLSFKEKKKKPELFKEDLEKSYSDFYKINKEYIIKPNFLKLSENTSSEEIKAKLIEKYPINKDKMNENGVQKEVFRVIGSLITLHPEDNPDHYYYFPIPGSKYRVKEEVIPLPQEKNPSKASLESKDKTKMLRKRGETFSESDKVELRENIKEILTQAFKSEDFNVESKAKELMEYLKNPFGRVFFIDSIFQSKVSEKAVKIVSEKTFDLLYKVIYGALLELIANEVTEMTLENGVGLIRSTLLYYKIVKRKNVFIFDEMGSKLNNYSLALRESFWEKWLDSMLAEDLEIKGKENMQDEMDKAVTRALSQITNYMLKARFKKDYIFNVMTQIAKLHIKGEKQLDVFRGDIGKVVRNYKAYV